MKSIATQLEHLGQLTELDATKRRLEPGAAGLKQLTLESDRVRGHLPAATLLHYDLRVSKGKKGAAKMRGKVCGGCFITLPSGQLADMLRVDVALQICGNCSIFILPGDPLPPAEAPAATKPDAAKAAPRKRKAKAPAPDAEPA